VRLLCEREVPLTHRLPAICLLQMHRKKGSLSLSLRFLLPMSEPGQSRPQGAVGAMSGLLPLATELRTLMVVRFVPHPDLCGAATASLFDHHVGAGEQRRWHDNSERLGSLHIDGQFEMGWLFDR
jgi:hypothetical protein